ncbi:hypothetical protein BDV25DRAFT_155213 [Aspergillus avenaceus]|uniref:Uncharacterized protein n=1 Tax=Aspergillus avenaceus TaxID=36643 RepID=A0A5N6TUJ3_ASPAV|nr:hypothetical protein BDV25DRAFT_155213 [Aspergillus avenaceus]
MHVCTYLRHAAGNIPGQNSLGIYSVFPYIFSFSFSFLRSERPHSEQYCTPYTRYGFKWNLLVAMPIQDFTF